MTRLISIAIFALLAAAALGQVPVDRLRVADALLADATTLGDYYKQDVYDPADQKIGQIVDLPIGKDGLVPAAIIAVGGFLGLRQKDVAIPFTALQLTERKNQPYLVLDATKDDLRRASEVRYNRMTRRWETVLP
jgi:hypothetical protein